MRTLIATLIASTVSMVAFQAAHAADAIDEVPQAPAAEYSEPVVKNWSGAYVGGNATWQKGKFNGQDQDRDLVHEHAEDDVAAQDQRDDQPARDLQRSHPADEGLRDLGQREEIAEDLGTEQDHHDHAGAVGGAAQDAHQRRHR